MTYFLGNSRKQKGKRESRNFFLDVLEFLTNEKEKDIPNLGEGRCASKNDGLI